MDVFIVANVVAAIAGAVVVLLFWMPCAPRPSRVRTAAVETKVIRQAAELWQNVDVTTEGACPSLSDLVATKKLDPHRTVDPWGSPYQIDCAEGEVHALSPGRDRKLHTPDDIRDDMKRADLDAIENR